MHSGANVLILDEPTNHLDLESREALEAALQAFKGSRAAVSHDRALLDAVGTRTVAVEDGTLHSYVGGWPEYVRVRAERPGRAQAKRAKPAKARQEPAATTGARRRTSSAGPSGWRRRSKPPRPASSRSRRSWPTRRRGTTRARPRSRPARHDAAKRALQELYAEWEEALGASRA